LGGLSDCATVCAESIACGGFEGDLAHLPVDVGGGGGGGEIVELGGEVGAVLVGKAGVGVGAPGVEVEAEHAGAGGGGDGVFDQAAGDSAQAGDAAEAFDTAADVEIAADALEQTFGGVQVGAEGWIGCLDVGDLVDEEKAGRA